MKSSRSSRSSSSRSSCSRSRSFTFGSKLLEPGSCYEDLLDLRPFSLEHYDRTCFDPENGARCVMLGKSGCTRRRWPKRWRREASSSSSSRCVWSSTPSRVMASLTTGFRLHARKHCTSCRATSGLAPGSLQGGAHLGAHAEAGARLRRPESEGRLRAQGAGL